MRPATLGAVGASLLLAGCAGTPAPAPAGPPLAPAAWQAPLPQAPGERAGALARWWQQFDDPLLPSLIARAQALSPNLAAARSRIAQARATQVAAGAALLPRLDASAAASRGRPDLAAPLGTSISAGVQAGWELDLFGADAAAGDAARARVGSAEAGWHDARVAVAVEVASAYLGLRACEAQLVLTRGDAASRAETARLTELSARAGFQAPATAALAVASAAQARAGVTQQQAACDSAVKSLVALAGGDEAALRVELDTAAARLPQPAQLDVDRVPAQVLAQRPDVLAAERELLAASADATGAERARLPRVALSGSIGAARFATGAGSDSGAVWSLGPLSVSLPLFDGGTRTANAAAARARHDEARLVYQARLRSAVREVEDALIALQSTASRSDDAQRAAAGFEASYLGTQARHRSGLASLFELEDARRTALAAQSALLELQRERVVAWISLYRALGGGWQDADLGAATEAGN